jgi:dephospho-CoA kinase
MNTKIVIGVAGMPGAGKSLVTEIAERMGYPVVTMGDVIREETKKRGLHLTPENMGVIMLRLREEEGSAAVARRSVSKIESKKSRIVVVDGLRSLNELGEFRRRFEKFVLIAVYASSETRFRRLFRRRRSDDPSGWATFHERDMRELSVGLGNAIALADYLIINEGERTETEKKILAVLRKVTENE